jgi:outer membrane lipoprotein-sorting protein
MILAHKRLSVAAALAMASAASVILYVSMFSFSARAYALEQTVQANNHITSYHAKVTPAAELGEAWVQLKPDGSPLQARMDLLSPDDGPKVVILSGEKGEVWFKKKNTFLIVRDKDALKGLMKMRALFDPKLAFEELQAEQHAGKTQVVTKEPAKEGELVMLTVTSKATPDRREVYEVDPKTKLVERVTTYRRHGDRWEQIEQREYLDYNKEIDPRVFQPELPKDVIKIDQIHEEIGLAKGNLTDNEIATKVVREFFEALIAEDYKKVGMILSGMPAEKMKESFGRYKFLRIVEIGKPAPHAYTGSLQVPVKVECELEGKKAVRPFSPLARPLYGQPDRWEIIGGI